MLLESYYPDDIRVSKEAKSLIQSGFEVHLLCFCRTNELKFEQKNGIQIHRINVGTNDYFHAFWDVVNAMSFNHPKFKVAASEILQQHDIRLVHVHDLPLAGTAIKLKAKHDIKVILDLHENYPEALRVWHKWKKNPIARLKNKWFLNYDRWFRFEKYAVQHCDQLICVVDEMKDRIIASHNIDAGKISVITNSEEYSFIEQVLDKGIYGEHRNSFIITYTGGVGPHRGVDTLVEAMGKLKSHDDIYLYIAGSGSHNVMEHLHDLIKKYGLEKRAFLLGYQPFSSFFSFMKMASVNVIPHHSNGHTDNTIPHKLFQGMMAGKPLVVSSSSSIKRVVELANSGLIFHAGDKNDLADKLETLYRNKNLREELGQNGFNATVKGDLNWERTSRQLVSLYQSLN